MLVRLVNRLDQPTNLHVHGLHVSPAADSDNVLRKIPPGESFDYLYALPIDQPAGLNWVHSHASGDSDAQVFGGLASAIIIEGDLDGLPGVAGVPERLLVLQAFRRDAQGRVAPGDETPDAPYQRLVNGQLAPTIQIRPGQTQRWRILNASADTYYLLQLTDHPFHQIATDGNTLGEVWTRDQILMPPGKRVEVLIQGGPPGVYELRTLAYDKGPQPAGMGARSEPETVLATLVSEGSAEVPQPLPTTLLPFVDLRSVPIDQRREITFDVPAGMPQRFAINGQVADTSRVDLTVRANTTEEWVIRNTSDQVHPFHIHVNPFQVIAVNGEPVPARGYEDVVNLPRLGEVTIRQRFAHFMGTTVFHCHILMHEDLGMLAVFQIAP
jgi:FtsP/CotA-like multicopper oxidase with cupredoxin domain